MFNSFFFLFLFYALHARIKENGNPKVYGGWLDESLNMVLRSVGRFAHRANLEIRIFIVFDLQGRLGLRPELFGISPS